MLNYHFGRWVSWDDKDTGKLRHLFFSVHTLKCGFEIGTDRDVDVENNLESKHRSVYFGVQYKRDGQTVLIEKQFPKTKWVPRAS